MTNALQGALQRARDEKRAALVVYFCAGDPNLEATPSLILAAAKAGADIIEVGMPFSDPTADGPVIQQASERALAQGTTLPVVLDAVAQAQKRHDQHIPIVLYSYYNPILAYGQDALVADAAQAGIDGMLVVDLPPRESHPLREVMQTRGMHMIPLLAPTSGPQRINEAAAIAGSFIYYVSLTGVTGAKLANLSEAAQRAQVLREQTKVPVALGFGIKNPEDVRAVAPHVDAVVVGSAVVQCISDAANAEDAAQALYTKVAALRTGTAWNS